jgi:hypothetical protein
MASSPSFSLSIATSPLPNIGTSPRRVTFHSHRVKTSLLPPLHLLATVCPIASPLEPNRSIESAPPPLVSLPEPSNSYPPLLLKDYSSLGHSPHHSTASPFCILPSQSTTLLELHPPLSFSFTVVPRLSSLCTTTSIVAN